eukprot:m.560675 g.560675  ORF g.560675 m.560675 type:complete len:269 (+) comp22212_c2_seq5:75-881(+)
MQVLSGLLPLAVCCVVIAATPIRQEGTSGTALDDGIKAIDFYLKGNTDLKCGWERGTFMLGLIELYKASKSQHLLDYAMNWGNHYEWKLCNFDTRVGGALSAMDPPGIENANNQLCGATYIELYKLDGASNKTMIAATMAEFDSEISDPKTTSYWSWVDALFMAMNPYARLGGVTGEQKYFDKMFANFNASCLEGPVPDKTYAFWSDEYHLFYRDDRFLKSTTFWGRGNGWAMGALVAALQNSPASDPHTDVLYRLAVVVTCFSCCEG